MNNFNLKHIIYNSWSLVKDSDDVFLFSQQLADLVKDSDDVFLFSQQLAVLVKDSDDVFLFSQQLALAFNCSQLDWRTRTTSYKEQ